MIDRNVRVLKEMFSQGVSNELDLNGPLGDEIRVERKPIIEELVRQGKVTPDILTKFG